MLCSYGRIFKSLATLVFICASFSLVPRLTSSAAAETAGQVAAYEINVGDSLQVDILDANSPPQSYTVGSDGQLQLPFVGGVMVSGLTLIEAQKLVEQTYVESQVYVHPTVVISIASFRPVFVMGDVKTPGYYEYHSFLTAEQALGLAGGPAAAANSGETRILQRNSLDGELSGIDSDLAAMAAKYARVQAQMNGESKIDWKDLPDTVQSVAKRNLFDSLKPGEEQILAVEQQNFQTQKKVLLDAVDETKSQIVLLGQKEELVTKALESAREDLARTHELVDKGLKPQTTITPLERVVTDTQAQLLAAREQESAARVKLGGLMSEISKFDSQRQGDLLAQSQTFWSGIGKLEAQRSATVDQINLLQQWMSASSTSNSESLMEYQVRRRVGGVLKQIKLDPFDELVPGDQLVVVAKPAEKAAEVGQ
jgi:protein involved in polysaccharide export with SLBB domain